MTYSDLGKISEHHPQNDSSLKSDLPICFFKGELDPQGRAGSEGLVKKRPHLQETTHRSQHVSPSSAAPPGSSRIPTDRSRPVLRAHLRGDVIGLIHQVGRLSSDATRTHRRSATSGVRGSRRREFGRGVQVGRSWVGFWIQRIDDDFQLEGGQ